MANLQQFFSQYREALDQYKVSISKAIEKNLIVKADQDSTLNTCIEETKKILLKHTENLDVQSKQLQQDLVDGLNLYNKDYQKESEKMVEKAQTMWDTTHQDKTNMLWSKEEYFTSKQSYHNSQDKI